MLQIKRLAASLMDLLRNQIVAASVVTAIVLFAWSPTAMAQSGAGAIQGTVKDSTGAVIPAASVHVLNDATGVAINTKTNKVGFYHVPGLFTGTYTVTISAHGMKTYKASLKLLVAQSAVINPVLTPGKVTQQITVHGNEAQLLDAHNGTLTNTLENQRINQLPMNQRSIISLVGYTTPGLEDVGQKMDGLPVEAMRYVVDGISTENNLIGGEESQDNHATNSQTIDPDSIQEVRVEATDAGAQYATPTTAIITTKSGTNTLHGTFFETARNSAIGIAKSRQDPSNFAAPHLVRNEFGASLGGPIVIPRLYHGRNRSFFFFAYERYSLASSVPRLSRVPTAAMRRGDFSGLVNGAGILQVLYNPATTQDNANCPVPDSTRTTNNPYCRTPFPNNQIPESEMSPLAKLYDKLVPTPTNGKNPMVESNLTTLSANYHVRPQYTFRLDHVFNQNNRGYLRYTNNWSNINTVVGAENRAVNSGSINIPVGAAYGYRNVPTTSFLAAIGFTHIFSPTFSSETTIGQQWLRDAQEPGIAPNVNYESMLHLPNNFGEVGFPAITGMFQNLGTSQQGTAKISQIVSNVEENLTKIVGNNQIQFGFRFRHQRDGDEPNHTADRISFGGLPVALYNPRSGKNYHSYPHTGSSHGAFFTGIAGSYSVHLEPPHIHYHVIEIDGYTQDNYHVSTNLTINAGLRYEAHPAIWTADGLANTFDLKHDAMVMASTPAQLIAKGYTTQAIITNDKLIGVKFETPAQAGMPAHTLMKNYYLNFLPRFGMAWQPFGGRSGTVIRGGYGRYDFPTPLEDYVNHPEVNNPFTAGYSQNYFGAAQSVDGYPNELLRYDGATKFGVAGENTANVVDSNSTTSILPGISLFSVDPNWKPTYVTETNLTIGQRLMDHSVLRVSYVWTHANNLDVELHYNNHPSLYQYEMAYGTLPPHGGKSVIGTPAQNTYASTATGPYDQTTWGGGSTYHMRVGWSNYNALQVNYQRLFHRGYAYQFTFVYAKAMRMGGNQTEGLSNVDPIANYPGVLGTQGTMTSPYGQIYHGAPPPPRPTGTPVWGDYRALNNYELYQVDSGQPPMHIRFNGIVDLPIGRGKWILGHANRFLNELVGGFQIAAIGNIYDTLFSPNEGNWGPTHPLKVYGHHAPITDCLSGVCEKAYLWFNGYLPPTVTTDCTKNCVTGLPTNYEPDQTPIDNTPSSQYYGTNDVVVTLANGKQTVVAYDGGPKGADYMAKTWLRGPTNWTVDASLYKVFPITHKVRLRVHIDAFNAFNVQGYNDPGGNGIETMNSSFNTPRQIQLTARLTF